MEEWVNRNKLPISLGLGGLILIGLGVFWWRMPSEDAEKVVVLSAHEVSSESGVLVVDIAGAVKKSGVYKLDSGARLGEAIQMAGGLDETADGEWVAKYLNLADKVKDGQKIYVPARGQNQKAYEEVNTQNQSPKINLNSANQQELESLSGVGPVTAGKIISGRPYSRIEELVEKKIVGQKVWEQIRELVALW